MVHLKLACLNKNQERLNSNINKTYVKKWVVEGLNIIIVILFFIKKGN